MVKVGITVLRIGCQPCQCWFCSRHRDNIQIDQIQVQRAFQAMKNKIRKIQSNFIIDQLTSPEPPAESKCTYNWFKVSLSFFCVFFWGNKTIPWKLTGSPYRKTDSTKTRKAYKIENFNRWNASLQLLKLTLTWIQAMKDSLKFTLSQRTSGPNCFFLSVANLVISSLPAWSSWAS